MHTAKRLPMRPKVAIVAFDCLRRRTGVSRAISTFAAYFGDRVVVVTDCYREGVTHRINDATKIYVLGDRTSSLGAKSLIGFVRAPARILSLANEIDVTLLNAHGYFSLLVSCAARLLSGGRLKVSWLAYDFNDLFLTFLDGAIGRLLTSTGLVNQIVVLSVGMKRFVEETLGFSNTCVLRIGVSPSLVAVSNRLLERQSMSLVKQKLRIDPSLRPFAKLYFHDSLLPHRRLEDLLRAVSILKNEFGVKRIVVYVAGSLRLNPRYVRGLMQLIGRLNLTREIIFLGSLEDDESIGFMYSYSDIFVFPCSPQSWGLAPLEAMLFGKPVIVTYGSGVSEILAGIDVAEIVPPRSPRDLANSIMNMIREMKHRQRRRKTALHARSFVLKNMTYVSTGRQLEEMWKPLINP